MNGPPNAQDDEHGPGEPDGPDDLDRAYQRARARDTSGPGPQVRQAILAQARRAVAAPRPRRGSPGPAANDARWHWQAAAGIAAVGFVGLLAWRFVQVTPPGPLAVRSPATSRPAPASAPALPSALVTVPEQERMLQQSAAAAVRAAAPPAPTPSPALASAATSAAAGAIARVTAPSAARSDRAALRTADVELAAAVPGWPERVLAITRGLYPELFGAAAAMSAQRPVIVTIALNADGSVLGSSRDADARGVPEQRDAAALVERAFALATGSLTASGVLVPAGGPIVVYGVRAAPDVNATGTR